MVSFWFVESRTGSRGCGCWMVRVSAVPFFDRMNSMARRVLCSQLVSREAAKRNEKWSVVRSAGGGDCGVAAGF